MDSKSRASRSSSRIRGGKRTEQKKDDGDQTREGTTEGTLHDVSISMVTRKVHQKDPGRPPSHLMKAALEKL